MYHRISDILRLFRVCLRRTARAATGGKFSDAYNLPIVRPEIDRGVSGPRRGFLPCALLAALMAKAMEPAERLDFVVGFGTRGLCGAPRSRVGPPGVLSGPTVLPRTFSLRGFRSGLPVPWCRRRWRPRRAPGDGSGRRRPAAGALEGAAAVGRRSRLLLRS